MATNRTPTRFYGPELLPNTPGTLYTVPADKIAVIKNISITPFDTDQIQLGINGITSADLFHLENFVEGPTAERWKYIVLTEAETLQGDSSTAGLAVTIDGDLYDA